VAQPIITFTTDFGPNDHFVGTMKGVVLSLNPAAQMVDICNNVYSFDVLDGALTIGSSYKYFPAGTVHMVVVDPGVGSQRRPLLVTTHTYHFIAPDNGVLSMIYDQEERVIVRHITAEHYFLHPVSHTFHGRDIFAPVAGYVSRGVEPHKIGEEITDFVRFKLPKAQKTSEGAMKGVILKVDKFGNLMTNFRPEELPEIFADGRKFKLSVGNTTVSTLHDFYAEGKSGEVFAIVGSMGYLEIAANRAAAAQVVGANRGSEVQIEVA
jgi:S-adenosyl-L-methionine hydrolase (adenosine-forming)